MNYTQAAIEQYGISSADRVLQFASASFDAHVEEVFPCLSRGGTLVLRNDEMLDCRKFLQCCGEWQLTLVSLPSGFWHELTRAIAADGLVVPATLRLVVIGGEQALPERVAAWFQCVDGRVRLMNTYGPTETTVVATAAELGRQDGLERRVAIGRPLGNTRVYVLDRSRQPVPVGVPGELYIGGESLARGYLNRPELNEERFVIDPFGKAGARMYKTGDVVRWRNDGRLEFIGRTDQQVKIRGFRIEPGEVEQVLREHPAVADAAVVARERSPGDLHLVAYLVASEGGAPVAAELRQFLRSRLPAFMVPTALVVLDRLPINASGKVDRRALPAPDWGKEGMGRENEFIAPRTATEQQLAAIWSEVLNIERLGVHDNFFDLGGHSLLAIQVVSRINRELDLGISLRDLFEAATLEALAERIEVARLAGSRGNLPAVRPVPRGVPLPLSFGQEALWVISQLVEGYSPYVTFPAARIRGPLNVSALERALNEIAQRQESLRTTFTEVEGRPVQVIAAYAPQPLTVVDLSGVPAEEREQEVWRYAEARSLRPIDLSKGPVASVELLRLGADEHVVLIGMHHIIYDGWSMAVLERELLTAYRALAAGLPSPLPELPVQYADFAVWQRERLQGDVLDGLRGYWLKQLAGLPALELPTDRPRSSAQTGRGANGKRQLPRQLSEAVTRLSRAERVTTFMTLVAVFQTLLQRYSGQDDFPIGTPVAGRLRPETEDLIGYFVNMLVLRGPFGRPVVPRVAGPHARNGPRGLRSPGASFRALGAGSQSASRFESPPGVPSDVHTAKYPAGIAGTRGVGIQRAGRRDGVCRQGLRPGDVRPRE